MRISKTTIATAAFIIGIHVAGTYSMIAAMDLQTKMMAENNVTSEHANTRFADKLNEPKYADAKNDAYFSSPEFQQKIAIWNDGEAAVRTGLDEALVQTEMQAKLFPFSKDVLDRLKNMQNNRIPLDIESVNTYTALSMAEESCTTPNNAIKPEYKELAVKYFCK